VRHPDWRALHAPPPIAGRRHPARTGRRPRHFSSLDERANDRLRRIGALVLAVAGLGGIVALLLVPLFRIQHVVVTGNHRLTEAQVVAAAGLDRPGSVFLVDPGSTERRLRTATWVRSASVWSELPDRVRISVDEWQPVAVYRADPAHPFYVSDQAVALGPADGSDAAALLAIDGPQQASVKAGRPALDQRLLTNLVNIQRTLPGLIGQDVRSFTIDACGGVTLNSKRGWKAQFGRVLTPEEFTSLRDKLGDLKALQASGEVNYDNPKLQYVNVMNPADVAVDDGSVRPSPSPSSRTSRGAAARSATPQPAPTAPPVAAACR
jgi:cell division septal protein FtsQ